MGNEVGNAPSAAQCTELNLPKEVCVALIDRKCVGVTKAASRFLPTWWAWLSPNLTQCATAAGHRAGSSRTKKCGLHPGQRGG